MTIMRMRMRSVESRTTIVTIHEHRNEEVHSHTVAREWIASPELSHARTPLFRSPAARCS